MKDSPKIKSISQYQQGDKKKSPKEAQVPPTRKPSVESTGEGYYKELMKQGGAKVKSISQYNKK